MFSPLRLNLWQWFSQHFWSSTVHRILSPVQGQQRGTDRTPPGAARRLAQERETNTNNRTGLAISNRGCLTCPEAPENIFASLSLIECGSHYHVYSVCLCREEGKELSSDVWCAGRGGSACNRRRLTVYLSRAEIHVSLFSFNPMERVCDYPHFHMRKSRSLVQRSRNSPRLYCQEMAESGFKIKSVLSPHCSISSQYDMLHGNPLQDSCLENLHGQRSLAGYSLEDCKGSDTTEMT